MDKRKKIFRRNAQFLGNLLASVTRRSLRGHFNDLRSPLIRVDKEVTGVSLIERKLIMQSERARIWKDFRAQEGEDDAGVEKPNDPSQDQRRKQIARVLHKLCYVSSVAFCSDAFQTWKAKTKFKYSKGVDLLLKGSETLDELFKKNEALRKELVYINEKLQHQAGLIKDEENQARQSIAQRQSHSSNVLQRIRLQRAMQILEERSIRASYRLLKSYSDFVRRKFVMLSRFPKPRRKLWWEKLGESQYDHFYDDAQRVAHDAPIRFRDTYFLIIEQRLIPLILRLQRFIRRRAFGKWLLEQNPEANKNWRQQFMVSINYRVTKNQ